MTKVSSKDSNIYHFMQQQHCSSYSQLYQWSISHRGDFWRAAIAAIKIKFAQPYSEILDLSQGPENPSWLVGAKYNIVASCMQGAADQTAIIYQDHSKQIQTVSYAQLRVLTNRVANSLVKLGFKTGDPIAIDMIMTAEAVAIYLGIIQAGCVVVGIADSFAAAEVAKRLQLSDAKAIFTQDVIMRDAKELQLYSKLIAADLPRAIVLPAQNNKLTVELRAGDLSWQEFLDDNPEFDPIICSPHDPINILFSSGTTGDPKAIVWDQTSPLKCAIDGYLYQDIHSSDIIAWPSSLGWMMGPWLIFAALINRATLALYYDVATTKNFTEFVAKAKVTILGVVPTIVRAWRSNNCCVGVDWSHIKLFTSTGEASNASDMQYLMQQAGGAPVIEYCGGTEISGAYITSTVLQENIPATFSTVTLGLELKLIDNAGNYVQQGEVALVPPSIGLSRVLLKRDNYAEYYGSMPKPADGTVLRKHGDQMLRLENGYYKSLGRADDTMKLGGIKISAAEIEHCFLDIPGLVETAAIGVNNADGLTELVVYVVSDPGVTLDLAQLQQQLQAAIKSKLNPLFKIHAVKAIAALPRTNSNKVMRRMLRAVPPPNV